MRRRKFEFHCDNAPGEEKGSQDANEAWSSSYFTNYSQSHPSSGIYTPTNIPGSSWASFITIMQTRPVSQDGDDFEF
jgi:hypothetical protein